MFVHLLTLYIMNSKHSSYRGI